MALEEPKRVPKQTGLRWANFLKFRRVTIRGAQPSARLSEEIRLSEGSEGVSHRALQGLSEGSAGCLRGSAKSARFSEVVGGSDPMLVTLGSCWTITRTKAWGYFSRSDPKIA